MHDSKELTGQCFCGKITYSLTRPTKMFTHCHCESCRRSHAAAFVSWTSVADENFHLQSGSENLSIYESSKDILWKFCRTCGSSLFQTTRHSPGITYVAVATLTAKMDRDPEAHVSFEEKVPWLDIQDQLPKHKEKSSDRISTNRGFGASS